MPDNQLANRRRLGAFLLAANDDGAQADNGQRQETYKPDDRQRAVSGGGEGFEGNGRGAKDQR
ncbi:MAG: hypothetical protein IPH82_05845 [Chloroflexi bacterium]|nr:hypothetical protein [Chloroflexota bacterium]